METEVFPMGKVSTMWSWSLTFI